MPIEPFKSEILQLADGSGMYWEASGNPKGKPALYLHGGPESRLIVVEAEGHGGSVMADEFTKAIVGFLPE